MAFRGSGGVMGGARGALSRRGTSGADVHGLEDLEGALLDFMPREAKAILRRTVRGVAAEIRKDARRSAPKDEGTLRKAIVSRGIKGKRTEESAGVFVTHGRGARHDAWYWFFLEWGTIKKPAVPFLTPAIERARVGFVSYFQSQFGKQLEKEMEKRAKRAGTA